MNIREQTKALNIARKILEYNIQAKYYINGNIFTFDENKIKELQIKYDKINATVKILYPKSNSETFLFNIKKNIGFNDNVDNITKKLMGD